MAAFSHICSDSLLIYLPDVQPPVWSWWISPYQMAASPSPSHCDWLTTSGMECGTFLIGSADCASMGSMSTCTLGNAHTNQSVVLRYDLHPLLQLDCSFLRYVLLPGEQTSFQPLSVTYFRTYICSSYKPLRCMQCHSSLFTAASKVCGTFMWTHFS